MTAEREREMREAILGVMRAPGYWPRTARDLMRMLAIPTPERHAFKRVLRSLLSDREVIRVRPNRYMPSARRRAQAHGSRPASAERRRRSARRADGPRGEDAPLIAGWLQRTRRGFGFVVPDRGGQDVFIPVWGMGEIMNGDRVQVRVRRRVRGGRLQGEVVRVLERSRRRVMGVFREAPGEGGGYVEAYDRQFERGIAIPAGGRGGAEDGLVVGVEIVRAPRERERAAGRVVEVVGAPDEPGVDLRTIVRKYDLRTEFPPDVMAEAERVPSRLVAGAAGRREDFRDLPIVTIDGETAMDFDDAVFVRKLPEGRYELQVHIADVAHYVRASSALDREAYERGTSVYFPGTAIPMLPPALSSGICSLNPGVDRLVQSCLMTVDGYGRVVGYRFAQGVIRSAARMTYTEVARILVDRDRPTMARYRDLVPVFRLMAELSEILNARRRRQGSIDFDLPEPEIVLAATGEMTGILALERNLAHRLIEEFMLAANETVARHLWRARWPSLYRVHERPEPRKLEEFDAVARAFGYALPRPFTSIEPAAFQALLDAARGRPEERFLSRLMLRSMKQARYSEERDIHFGLASSCYTHFTSPIRRYPDLVVHRVLKRALAGRPPSEEERVALEGFLPEAAVRASRAERNADAAENELVQRKKLAFMADRLGEEFDGFILSVHPYGLLVELRDLFVDGLVPVDSLGDDRYRFLERRQILKGERRGRTFRVGQPVRVRVDRVRHFLLEIDFSLAEGDRAEGGRAGRAGGARIPRRRRRPPGGG
ncbi:MAG: ribonuclease R [Acidobacteriota bacterium]